MEGSFLRKAETGGAWLSSARVVRCWVKSRNERNPVISCQHSVGHSSETAGVNRRKVGMTSNHHAPYVLGYTRATMGYNEKQDREMEQISKIRPSSDWRLQLAYMKPESLVIADQHAAVNTFPWSTVESGTGVES